MDKLSDAEKQNEELGHAVLLYRRLLKFLVERYAGGRAVMTAEDAAELSRLNLDVAQPETGETILETRQKFPAVDLPPGTDK